MLVAVSTGVGALATLPAGVLVDRARRTRVLWTAILAWAAAMALAGAATSFLMLLFCRLALGVVVAAATPAIASLTGDLFPAAERGRIYGYILFGELVGAALGYLVAGAVAGPLSWRYSFWVLALPALALAWAVSRLREPARGGYSRLPVGAQRVPTPPGEQGPSRSGAQQRAPSREDGSSPVAREVDVQQVSPRPSLVLRDDPSRCSLWWAVRYVLSIRTNLYLIAASALGYFYFTGLRAFAVLYLRARFGLGQSVASVLLVVIGLGAILGVLVSGRTADRVITRRYLPARVLIAGLAFLLGAALFVPGLLVGTLAAALPLLFLAMVGVGGANPPLDAARLDIMHPQLWGRAESVRAVLRRAFEAVAPLLFGYVSTAFGGSSSGLGAQGASPAGGTGLEYTFLIMLVPLAAGGLLLLRGRHSYPRDLATALASVDATSDSQNT